MDGARIRAGGQRAWLVLARACGWRGRLAFADDEASAVCTVGARRGRAARAVRWREWRYLQLGLFLLRHPVAWAARVEAGRRLAGRAAVLVRA